LESIFNFAPQYQIEPWHWFLAILAAFLMGVSKSGLKGITVLIVTLLALVFGGKASTGIMMPLLITGDILAVIYYNRHANWGYLFKLLPWMIIGVLFGAYFGKDLPEVIFKKGMAVIILLTVFLMLWWDQKKESKIPDTTFFAASMGLSAGFTTMIGNLAGAFSNLFFLAMRVPKNVFIGTTAWLFFIINLFKLPFHIFYWKTITVESFKVNLILIPFTILGLFIGVKIVDLIKETFYRKMILVLTAVGAILIFFR